MKNKKDKKLSDLIKSLITERDELKNTIQETKEQLGATQASINRIIDVIGTRSENSRGSRGGLMYTENIERIPSATLILKEVMRLKEELARKDESSAAEVKKSSTMFELLRIVLHDPTIMQDGEIKKDVIEKIAQGKLPERALQEMLNLKRENYRDY